MHNSFDRQLCAFGGTHPTEANGPLKRANPELFEAVRPSFQDLVSKAMDGSKSTYKKVKRGYTKLSTYEQGLGYHFVELWATVAPNIVGDC